MNGRELKAARKRLGLSLREAAKQCEVTPRTYCRWETMEAPPKIGVKLFCLVNGIKIAPAKKR